MSDAVIENRPEPASPLDVGAAPASPTEARSLAPPGDPDALAARADRMRAAAPALAALIILAFALVAFVWLAGRIVRRQARKRFGPTQPVGDEWAKKPLKMSPASPPDAPPKAPAPPSP